MTTSAVHSYTAYGLGIHSAIPLPELRRAERAADVVIREGRVDGPRPPELPGKCLRAGAREVCMYWRDVGVFLAVDGRELVVDAAPGVAGDLLRLLLLGPMLAVLVHQRGLLALHASAVRMAGAVTAFLGGPRWGKSTTAAALHKRGHLLVADDVTAVDTTSDRLMVQPAVPRLKLWPDVAASLGEDAESLPRLHARLEKRDRPVTRAFERRPRPLGRLYVLAEGEGLEITRLKPQDAFTELVRHSYLARLLKQTGSLASHFRQCERVVGSVPVSRLARPLALARLPDLAQLVEEDVARHA